jgi:hypothetical protein
MGRVGLDLRLSGHEPGARLAGVEGSPQAAHSSDFEGHPRAPTGHRSASSGGQHAPSRRSANRLRRFDFGRRR